MNESITDLLPVIIPLAVIQLTLMVVALAHVLRAKKYKTGSRVLWVVVCIFFAMVGPILYFVLGRTDEAAEEE